MKTEEMQKILLCLFLFVLLISAYDFFRFKNDPGSFTYDEYRYIVIADKIVSSHFSLSVIKDSLTEPLAILLAACRDYRLAMRLLPYIFILPNLILVFWLAKKIRMNEKHMFYSLLCLALSPVFIYNHIVFSQGFITLFLILSGTLLFLYTKPAFGLVFLLLCLWINPWSFFVISCLLLIMFQKMKETKKGFEAFALLLVLFVFLWLKGFSLPAQWNFLDMTKDLITDLGASYGIGIFGTLTAGIGIILFFRGKTEEKSPIWLILLFFIFSLYDKFFLVFFDVFAAYFAGLAILRITGGSWDSSILKNYVAMLILCGLVFSAGSYLNKTYRSGASYGDRLSIDWLSSNYENGKVVLSYYNFGYLISSSGFVPFTDKDYYLYSKERNKIIESQDIFMSRDLKNITNFMKGNNIKYVWINSAMKTGLVWSKADEGMLFTMENSVSFRKVYNYDDVEIWEFLPDKGNI